MESTEKPAWKIAVTDASVIFLLALAVVGAIYGLMTWGEYYRTQKYADCVERGGTITEGGFSGPQCVGVKTRGSW